MAKFDYKKLNMDIRGKAKQRKEDNEEFYSTHLQSLTGGDAILEEVFDESCLSADIACFVCDRSEYKFSRFNDLVIGCDNVDDKKKQEIVNDTVFYYCNFSMCGFSNLCFQNCVFVGCNFTECYTLGFAVIFDNCRFMNLVLGESNIDDAPCMFTGCELSSRFVNSDLTMAVFDKSHFYFSQFKKTTLKDTIFLDSAFDTVHMSDMDMRNTKILNPKFIEFFIEDTDKKTKFSKYTYLDRIQMNHKEEREVRFAADVYSQFSELFEHNKLMDLNGEYFYLTKVTEKINLKGIAKFKSFLGQATCGYGERPSFSLLTALLLILTCGTLYMIFGVNINNEVISFWPTAQNPFPPLDQLIIWYHFSLVTFSTVGYGNVVPVGGSLIVSAFEMVLGVIMVGIWVSTLVRKMVR